MKTYLNCTLLSLLATLALAVPALAQDEPSDTPGQPPEQSTRQASPQAAPQATAEEASMDMPAADGAAAPVPEAGPPPDPFARDSYRIDPVICPFKGKIDYEPGDIECGLLQVPENREVPDSRFIELHFVKLNSRWGKDEGKEEEEEEESGLAPGKRDDPVIYLTGGPGSHVTYYVKRFKDHGLLDHRDLYILEQRGIGASQDFCPFYSGRKPALDDVATFEESLTAQLERVADCARNAAAAGVDLSAYNTIENARDVKALRRALGFERWNVWGISYGSILGQAYLKEDPEGILAFVIDAIMPLDIRESELYWRVAHWYDRDLRKLQEICDRQPACARHYPDIGGKLREAIRSVVDNPIEVAVKDTENYPSGKARIFQDTVAFLPFVFLYEQDNYPGIPGLVYAWADAVLRREEILFKAIASASDDAAFGGSSQGMANAILCVDGDNEAQARAGKKDILEYPDLGAAIGTAESWDRRADQCAELGMDQRPPEQYLPLETGLPGLVIEGDMDPITPPPNAKAILPGLKNATYVEFPYAGHGPSRSVKCAGDLLNKFYDDPTVQPDLSCAEEMKEPKIFAPLFLSTAAPRALVMLAEDKKQLIVPAAWAGSSVLVSLIAFLVLSFRPLARWIDGRPPEKPAARAGAVRLVAWLSATGCVAAVGILGAAIAVTAKTSDLLPLFGLVPWARWGAWLGLVAGVLGLVTVVVAIRQQRLPRSRVIGFVLTGLAALGLGLFLFSWDLGPF